MSDGWERLAAFWWQTLPMQAARLGGLSRRALADGLYLAAWPRAGALVPPTSLIIGMLMGWLYPSSGSGYTASPLFLALATIAGAAGAHPGLTLTVGYGLGDLLLGGWHSGHGASLWDAVAPRVGMLLAYFLLSQLTVFMPLIASGARRLARLPRPQARVPRLGMEMAVYGLLCAGSCYLWTVATPVLIRPAFTWRGTQPPVEAMQFLQHRGEWLALLAGLAGAGRVTLEAAAMRLPAGRQRLVTYVARLRAHTPATTGRISPYIAAIVSAALGTLLMAGALATWVDALLLATFLAVMHLLRQRQVFELPGTWVATMERIPFLARLAAAGTATWALAHWIVQLYWDHGGNTFRPVVLTVVIASLLVYLFCPPTRRAQARGEVHVQ